MVIVVNMYDVPVYSVVRSPGHGVVVSLVEGTANKSELFLGEVLHQTFQVAEVVQGVCEYVFHWANLLTLLLMNPCAIEYVRQIGTWHRRSLKPIINPHMIAPTHT